MPIRKQYEERILRIAREYARMKLFGASVDLNSDCFVYHCKTDSETQSKYMGELLLHECEKLLLAMCTDEIGGTLIP